eukprot:768813-Hanusia_phi.AAC.13
MSQAIRLWLYLRDRHPRESSCLPPPNPLSPLPPSPLPTLFLLFRPLPSQPSFSSSALSLLQAPTPTSSPSPVRSYPPALS